MSRSPSLTLKWQGANILITKLGVVKLADFGVATQLEPGMTSIDAVGTPYWSAC